MREIQDLQKRWNESAQFARFHPSLSLEKDALVLGAGTVIARRDTDRGLVVDGEEERILTLLSVAHGAPIDESVLSNLRYASKHARRGDECMAAMHIALAKLPRLDDAREAARSLFIAGGLIEAGITPRDIWTALEFDPRPLDELAKYNPDEPRNPKGEAHASGEWTRTGIVAPVIAAASSAASVAERVASAARSAGSRILARTPQVVAALAEILERLDLPLAVLSEVLQASDTGGAEKRGPVRGFPNLSYSRHQDELGLTLVNSGGHRLVTLFPTAIAGQFSDPRSGITGHMEKDGELVLGTSVRAASRAATQTQEPGLCPEPPMPDNAGMPGPVGERSRAYAAFMREQINGVNAVAPGLAFWLINPETGNIVKYDDCEFDTGDMLEYKGLQYAEMVGPNGFEPARGNIAREWLGEARRQVLASGGRRVRWYFAQMPALEFARTLFASDPLLSKVELEYGPWPEGERWKLKGGRWIRTNLRSSLRTPSNEFR